MAVQQDRWTRWMYWLDTGEYRYVRHTGDQTSGIPPYDSESDFKELVWNMKTWIAYATARAEAAEWDNAFIGVFNAISLAKEGLEILEYAAYDCRELLASAVLSKEDVFDLWLERAGEFTA